jgi:hypothetical protein
MTLGAHMTGNPLCPNRFDGSDASTNSVETVANQTDSGT